jgi:peptide/nickel transport system substrate-binding protein
MRKFTRGPAALLVITLMLGTLVLSPAATPPAQSAPGSSELVFGVAQDFGALDPRRLGSAMSFSMLRHFYEPLVWYDENSKIVPVLAESWERVDPTTVRFKLRRNARFHKGQPFNAEAVKFSLEQVLNPAFPAWMRFAVGGVIKGARVVDANTVDIQTERPVAVSALLQRLTVVDMVEPAHAVTPDQDRSPNGTGPYRFIEFLPRTHLRMERNPNYWGPAPQIERITVRIIPEESTRIAALQRGEAQIINTIPPESLPRLRQQTDLQLTTGPSLRHIFVHMRNDRKPFDKVQIRQALNYAVNKEAIVDHVLRDMAVVAKGQFAPILPGARTDLGPYPFDPARAKRLIQEAGYNNEPVTLGVGAGRFPNDRQVAEVVLSYVKSVGINARLVVMDFATYSAEIAKGTNSQFDFFLNGWSVVPPDPVLGLSSTVLSRGNAPRFNYQNPRVDAMIERAILATNEGELAGLLRDIQQQVWTDAPFIFMYHPIEIVAHSRRLEGFKARPDEFTFFQSTRLR